MKYLVLLSMTITGARASALAPTASGASLIDGTSRLEVDLGLRHSTVLAEAKPDGSRASDTKNETVRNWTVRSAHRFDDAWQAGGTLQLADRHRRGANSTALSEFKLNAGYRSTFPRLLSYAQISVPVSRSAFETGDTYQLNATGRGFWAFGIGQHVTTEWGGFLTCEVHRSLARSFANDKNAGVLRPGFGATFGAGYGTKFGNLSLGTAVTWTYEDPVAVRGDRVVKNGSAQRYGAPTLNAAYVFDQWQVGVAYSDQSILPAATTGLVREVGVTATWMPTEI